MTNRDTNFNRSRLGWLIALAVMTMPTVAPGQPKSQPTIAGFPCNRRAWCFRPPRRGSACAGWPSGALEKLRQRRERLEDAGHQLGMPAAKKLTGHPDVSELRFEVASGVWRVAYMHDGRRYILLSGGSKSGMSENWFYAQLVAKARSRFRQHVAAKGAAKR